MVTFSFASETIRKGTRDTTSFKKGDSRLTPRGTVREQKNKDTGKECPPLEAEQSHNGRGISVRDLEHGEVSARATAGNAIPFYQAGTSSTIDEQENTVKEHQQ